jgi:hypothetical protein
MRWVADSACMLVHASCPDSLLPSISGPARALWLAGSRRCLPTAQLLP